jgi:hypothetical protein
MCGMTRPEAVRFVRTEPSMAYPEGRLIAVREGAAHFLAADGWSPLGQAVPSNVAPLTREEAEDWCEREGWDLELLNTVPIPR